MKKENGRVSPADPKEVARMWGKTFICDACGCEFLVKGAEFGETITCPECKNIIEQPI